MRRIIVRLAVAAILLGACSRTVNPPVSLADAQRALCADIRSGPVTTDQTVPEAKLDQLLADATLFEQAGDKPTARGIRTLVSAMRSINRLRVERTEMAVFLVKEASQKEVSAVQLSLSQTAGVDSLRFESKDEALERFKEAFADQPLLIENVTADAFPASFRVHLSTPEKFDEIAATVQGLPGVENVTIDLTEAGAQIRGVQTMPAWWKCFASSSPASP
jgi:hypothetical protein